MRCIKIFFASLLLCVFASLSASAQLPPAEDSLALRNPRQSAAACSATDASSCAQAAAKIVPQVMGPSPMEENLRRLTDEIGGRVTGSPEMAKAVDVGAGRISRAGRRGSHGEIHAACDVA